MQCEAIAEQLAGVVDDSAHLTRGEKRHVEGCLRCQAELARYRKLLRAMHALRDEVAPPPPGLVGDVLAAVEAASGRGAVRAALTGRRVAYIGGIAAATAAAGAGAAVVLVSRGRRHRLLAG